MDLAPVGRWPLQRTLTGEPDPDGRHSYVNRGTGDWGGSVEAQLLIKRHLKPTRGELEEAAAFHTLAVTQIANALPGCRVQEIPTYGSQENFEPRRTLIEVLRPDMRPIRLLVRHLYYGHLSDLVLEIGADHAVAPVGLDVTLAMKQALALDSPMEPLASALKEFGSPISAEVQEGDRLVYIDGEAPSLLGLFGKSGTRSVTLTLARDGAFPDIQAPVKLLPRERVPALLSQLAAASLSPEGLAFGLQHLDL